MQAWYPALVWARQCFFNQGHLSGQGYMEATEAMTSLLPLVLALVPLQKFPIDFNISLCKMKMALPSQ